MKKVTFQVIIRCSYIFVALLILPPETHAQQNTLIGAWETFVTTGEGATKRGVVIFTDGFQSAAWFDAEDGSFIETNGGKWSINGNIVTEIIEFNSSDSLSVGKEVSFEVILEKGKLTLVESNLVWDRIDTGQPGDLAGAWLFSGRKQDETIVYRNTEGPRKTMKILSGTRFQWIAFHTETGGFFGTGGGNYTTQDGTYTETIDFFSRDNSRVGADLSFQYELKDNYWHHSGHNSRGEPLYEVWAPRKN